MTEGDKYIYENISMMQQEIKGINARLKKHDDLEKKFNDLYTLQEKTSLIVNGVSNNLNALTKIVDKLVAKEEERKERELEKLQQENKELKEEPKRDKKEYKYIAIGAILSFIFSLIIEIVK